MECDCVVNIKGLIWAHRPEKGNHKNTQPLHIFSKHSTIPILIIYETFHVHSNLECTTNWDRWGMGCSAMMIFVINKRIKCILFVFWLCCLHGISPATFFFLFSFVFFLENFPFPFFCRFWLLFNSLVLIRPLLRTLVLLSCGSIEVRWFVFSWSSRVERTECSSLTLFSSLNLARRIA